MKCTLEDFVKESQSLDQVYKNKLNVGDIVILKTVNSVYYLEVLEKEQYTVNGGWFDKNRLSPLTTKINGCTRGGSTLKSDIVAACGLKLEFGNGVVTSRINKVYHISNPVQN